nr:MAG TPA: hypothetical protein [Caudoviricetes sp.]DAP80515.1 MAG TPA: hypothetical protein [Caudoviricetes sp.]
MQKNISVVEIKLGNIIERSVKLDAIKQEYHSYLDLMSLQCSHLMVLWKTQRLVSISSNSFTMI